MEYILLLTVAAVVGVFYKAKLIDGARPEKIYNLLCQSNLSTQGYNDTMLMNGRNPLYCVGNNEVAVGYWMPLEIPGKETIMLILPKGDKMIVSFRAGAFHFWECNGVMGRRINDKGKGFLEQILNMVKDAKS